MRSFDLNILLAPGVIIFFATLWVAFRATHSPVFALLTAFLKAGVFIVYFGLLFDGTYTFLDDWSYLEGGQELQAQNVGITNLGDNWELALMIGGGDHFLYYLYNTYALRLFGEGYYAPVALNILLTLLVAWYGTRLVAREFGISGIRRKWFFGFLLLHPDILVWSNVMNGKDIFVLLMHILLLLSCSLFFKRQLLAALTLAVPVSFALFFLRFYVPLLFAAALIISLVLIRSGKGWLRLFFFGCVVATLVLTWLGTDGLQYALGAVSANFVNPLYGFVRFVLTPVPFNTEEAYSFLDFPALIHWMLFPFAIWGLIMVYRLHTPFSRFFLLYLLVFVSLYAVFGELQGPRHRVQLDFAWAVLQFMGVMAFLRAGLPSRRQLLAPIPAANALHYS